MSIILVSGGLDSATALAWALQELPAPHITLSFFYGQRHQIERAYAKDLCHHFALPEPINVNLAQPFVVIGGSSLTSGLVHGNPSLEHVERTPSELPPSFVPGRNLIMLSVAAGIGYTQKQYDIVGGWNAVDYSGYPDCRSAFIQGAQCAINLALGFTEHMEDGIDLAKVHIHTPLIKLSKAEIIKLGITLNVPYALTYSCYAGGELPCGTCDSCLIRQGGFADCGISDPALA